MEKIKIIKPGPFTTIQDKGRWGYQRFGIPVSGVMDDFATRIANILVGNHASEGVLESTYLGPEIQFYCDEVISITGGDMKPKINGIPVPLWTSLLVKEGDILKFSNATKGLRTYIGFSRGLDVPKIMESKSTFTRGQIGGYKGRKLSLGDEINLGSRDLCRFGSYLSQEWIPKYMNKGIIRFVLGPQDDFFPQESIERFLDSKYTITHEADRMGYRLDGLEIKHKDRADIISDGIAFGSIQVPGNGSPIIMMADRPTIGGYTKIGTVIFPDLGVLAQMGQGSIIKFQEVSLEEAHKIYKDYENGFKKIKDKIKDNTFNFHEIRNLQMNINGRKYAVDIRELNI